MKKILIASFVIATQTLFAQKILTNDYDVKTSLSDFDLNGKVEKIVSTAYDEKGNTTTLPFYENEFYDQVSLEFNPKGYLTKRTNYLDYRGKLAVYNFVDYRYNANNLIENQKNTVINNGEDRKRIASDKTFVYNGKNIISLTENIEGKNSKSRYESLFNYTDKLDKIITKVEGTIISENKLTYNKKDLLVLDETTSFDGKKGKKSYYIYDGKTPVFSEEFVGNSSKITFYENGSLSKIQSFDVNKNLVYQAEFNSNNEIVNFKKQSFRNGNSILTTYQISYEKDAKGNWTKASVTTDGILKYTVKRVINYY